MADVDEKPLKAEKKKGKKAKVSRQHKNDQHHTCWFIIVQATQRPHSHRHP